MNENENLVPKRRFKEFTNSDAWEERKLEDIFLYKQGQQVPVENQFTKPGKHRHRFIRIVDLTTTDEEPRYIEYSGHNTISATDLFMIRYGQPGVIGYGYEGVIANNLFKLIPKVKANNRFFKYRLDSMYPKIQSLSSSTTMPAISFKSLDVLDVRYPDIKEQEKIGAFFKQLDDTIALHQRKLEKSKALKSAYLSEMFPAEGERKPKRRFAGFTDDWEQCKVRELFTVTRGQVLAATKTKDKETDEFIYPVYSSQTKNNGLMGFYNQYLFENAITWTTDGANAGTVNFRKGKFYSTNVNGVLLSDKGYANKAISEIINKIAWKHVSKVGNPKLMNNIMSEITIMIPSIEELNKISILFNQIDNTIALHQHKLEKLKNIKQAYLNELFV